jgi:ABC-type uncharacterized transport system auxiliary subunit
MDTAAMANLDIANYMNQIQSFKAADHARENLVNVRWSCRVSRFPNSMLTRDQELIGKYSALLEEHAHLQSDYQSERDIRRNYQKSVDEKHRVVEEYNRQLVSLNMPLPLRGA